MNIIISKNKQVTASFATAVNPATTMSKNLHLAQLKSSLQGLMRNITLKTQAYYVLLN